jgi:nitrogen fixation/metabolism regulation signal transduction histidine kinase
MAFENRLLLLALAAGAPALALAMIFTWSSSLSLIGKIAVSLCCAGPWLYLAFSLRNRVVRPLQTISNLLAGLRQEDFSTRARDAGMKDALGDVLREINELSEILSEQRLGALEATALLRTVMEEIEVAVFTFDDGNKLRLVNRAGERLLAQPLERLLGRTAAELNLAECLEGEPGRTLQMAFPGGLGRWGMRRTSFRQHGLPHQLIVLADLSRALREEERQAWQRLLRVLGHELNNSLAPIKSISGSLSSLLAKNPRPVDWMEDMQGGLGIIAARSDALSRFMTSYTRLARLPPPKLQPLAITPWLQRVASLETRLAVMLVPGPDITIQADGDQLDQVLINLLRNAADAACESHVPQQDAMASEISKQTPQVVMSWGKAGNLMEIRIEDNGPGLANTTNLFVPFFTTKPGGSGIGLVLCRQIAEAHGGSLSLENRTAERGCLARLKLPLG